MHFPPLPLESRGYASVPSCGIQYMTFPVGGTTDMDAALSRLPRQCPFQVHRFLLPLFHCSTQGNSCHFPVRIPLLPKPALPSKFIPKDKHSANEVRLFFQKYTASVPDKKNFPLSHNFPMTLSGSIKILFSLPQRFSYGNRSHPHRRYTGLLERKPSRPFPPVLPKVLSPGWQDQRTVPALPRLPYAYRTPSLSLGTV